MLKKLLTQLLIVTTLLLLSSDVNLLAQTRIRFRPGASAANVADKLPARAARTYVLIAKAGQHLVADLSSETDGVRFGNNNLRLSYETVAGQNYVYISNTGKGSVTFTLTVSVQ